MRRRPDRVAAARHRGTRERRSRPERVERPHRRHGDREEPFSERERTRWIDEDVPASLASDAVLFCRSVGARLGQLRETALLGAGDAAAPGRQGFDRGVTVFRLAIDERAGQEQTEENDADGQRPPEGAPEMPGSVQVRCHHVRV